jgi:hypothetical protein
MVDAIKETLNYLNCKILEIYGYNHSHFSLKGYSNLSKYNNF